MTSGPGKTVFISGHIEPKLAAKFVIGRAKDLSPRTIRRRLDREDRAQARQAAKAALKKGGAA